MSVVTENRTALFQHRVKPDFDNIEMTVVIAVLYDAHRLDKIDGTDQPAPPVMFGKRGFKTGGNPGHKAALCRFGRTDRRQLIGKLRVVRMMPGVRQFHLDEIGMLLRKCFHLPGIAAQGDVPAVFDAEIKRGQIDRQISDLLFAQHAVQHHPVQAGGRLADAIGRHQHVFQRIKAGLMGSCQFAGAVTDQHIRPVAPLLPDIGQADLGYHCQQGTVWTAMPADLTFPELLQIQVQF